MSSKLDFTEIPIVDAHCHPFTEKTNVIRAKELPRLVTFCDVVHAEHALAYRQMIHELSNFLSCPSTAEDVTKARNTKAVQYTDYIKQLFDDAKISTLMVDDGYSEISVEHPIPEVEIDDFRKLIPCKVLRVTRLEPLIKTALDRSSKFEEFLTNFQTSLKYAVKKRGAVAFKILIAYRTGLDIRKASETDAKKAFRKYKAATLKAKLQPGFDIKSLRDYLVWLSVGNSIKLNVPLFFHTGIGDADIVLEKCNPTNMFNFLKNEDVRKAKIVLTHAGYPYAPEAGWLCSIFPNVYCDISVYTPFTHANMPTRIIEILELAQISKVLYGSDAFGIPEVHWLSVKMAKKAMSKAFEELIKFGTLHEDETYKAAEMILSENVKNLLNFSNVGS